MRAVAYDEFGGPEVLKVRDLEAPPIGPNSVLVRMSHAGVNPADSRIRQGTFVPMARHIFPIVPGWEGAGVIEQTGMAVRGLEPGQPVYGLFRRDYIGDGTYAEYSATAASDLLARPNDLPAEQAGGLALGGLTALMAVEEGLDLRRGQAVLVRGAAGGVGHFVVQLCAAAGARVIALSRTANHHFLRQLGATDVVDYAADDFEDQMREIAADGVDAAVDTVGGPGQSQLAEFVRYGGQVASCAGGPLDDSFARRNQTFSFDFLQANPRRLARLAEHVAAGRLRTHISQVFSMADATRAHEQIDSGRTRGKLVIQID
ncbi:MULTISPECIES: NADP-dependent oxidoreductase [Mycolicibacterium]|uniref:Zn-dependent oxidoreductase, NADPH:quinone reductase n=1 Tax=Mycolicibacterium senegalense TaxID=1796 RepID=A0A378W609_9MYCO|nr:MULTISPECIES: NADP-dependent oxidoreductase [Mycolicibacterium]MCV7336086.1 NADP-dependent oxidoreductase [Mycolicibacterium senegalense]MDR7287907.1 NADPH2:quinone reductase [Mycolicibacterium senegalense]QZA24911.1 NADP-dependent oxidoreductase [Mycolicibacterium senegalense]CDP86686.1 alcohol dehydrogenase [Mycolicibacterium farcinogenes]SUA28517.1 Zn-dependent oxidoreductase, NADPH:quinone reductase [Mycolicibacterium senegalense]